MASETHDMASAAASGLPGAEHMHTADAGGMPQLDFGSFPNQIFWLLVALAVIYWLLSRIALPRIAGVLGDRQGTIAGDIAAAEDFKRKAEEAEAAYEKALAEARANAQKIAGETKAEIQKDLDAAIVKADAEIAARSADSEKRITEIRDGALAAIDEVAKDTAGEIVAALGGKADKGAVNGAVDARMKG
ncbi:MAG: F0F1 ATP synthase subunit B' [Rhodobacteraceae bacterium]|nr:F0F1 ATP synthase subunit B' [Paracoccaceae bacterium]